MPLYAYRCECGNETEELQRNPIREPRKCGVCKKPTLNYVLSNTAKPQLAGYSVRQNAHRLTRGRGF